MTMPFDTFNSKLMYSLKLKTFRLTSFLTREQYKLNQEYAMKVTENVLFYFIEKQGYDITECFSEQGTDKYDSILDIITGLSLVDIAVIGNSEVKVYYNNKKELLSLPFSLVRGD